MKKPILKKGVYAVIGTFIFIMVAVAVAIGLIGYGYYIAGVEEAISSSINRFDIADDVKEKILFCYGAGGIIDVEKLGKECQIDYGYILSTQFYGSCEEEILKEAFSKTPLQE